MLAARAVRDRSYHRSRFLITGIALLVLGVGNVLIGSQKLIQYQRVVAEGQARGYFPDADGTNPIMHPLDEEGERYNIGRAKVDLYHVVLSGGLLMLGIGAIFTVAALIRLHVRKAIPR
jgi:hypothetical protein